MLHPTCPETLPSSVALSLQRQADVLVCRACAIECNTDGQCAHGTLAERALTGTWDTDAVRMSVQKGYEIVEIIEVYECAFT